MRFDAPAAVSYAWVPRSPRDPNPRPRLPVGKDLKRQEELQKIRHSGLETRALMSSPDVMPSIDAIKTEMTGFDASDFDKQMAAYRAAAGAQHRSKSQNTQHNNNVLGTAGVTRERPGVRSSKMNREQGSGNAAKSLLGQDRLAWKLDRQEGAFKGRPVHDALGGDKTYAAEVAMEESIGRMNLDGSGGVAALAGGDPEITPYSKGKCGPSLFAHPSEIGIRPKVRGGPARNLHGGNRRAGMMSLGLDPSNNTSWDNPLACGYSGGVQ